MVAERNTTTNNNNSNICIGHENQHSTPAMGEEVRIPISYVTRVMQSVLPPDTIITDDANELMQLCVSKFMDKVTSEAFQQANVEHQMIVSADDLLWTMNRLGFEEFVRSLGKDLKNYRNNTDGSGASGSNNANDDDLG